jgi:hypothetical protein
MDDRKSLAERREALMAKSLIWVRNTRQFQRAINIGSLLGVIMLGFGSSMSGDLVPAGGGLTQKGLVVAFGALFGFAGGIVALFLQDEAPALLASASDLEREAQKFLDERDVLNRELQGCADRDQKRLALIDANRTMHEVLEQALLIPSADPAAIIDMMVETALPHLLVSVGFAQDEAWAISVFEVQGEELVRISAKRAHRADEQKVARRWKKNEGVVGAAWARQDVVIVADGQDGATADELKVPADLQRTYDATHYRSMAAVPLSVGDTATVWGVVAVSTDRVGRFRRLPGDRQEQAVDTVRLIARMIALMAAVFQRSQS